MFHLSIILCESPPHEPRPSHEFTKRQSILQMTYVPSYARPLLFMFFLVSIGWHLGNLLPATFSIVIVDFTSVGGVNGLEGVVKVRTEMMSSGNKPTLQTCKNDELNEPKVNVAIEIQKYKDPSLSPKIKSLSFSSYNTKQLYSNQTQVTQLHTNKPN